MVKLNWKMLDRLGRGAVTAMLTDRLGSRHFSAKTGEKGGRRGLRPWPLRCLSQLLSERESRLFRRRRLHKSMLEIVRL